jgi:hypothetical protein
MTVIKLLCGSSYFVNDVFCVFEGGGRLSNESDSFFPQRGLWAQALGPGPPDSRLIHRPPKIPTVLIHCLGRECLAGIAQGMQFRCLDTPGESQLIESLKIKIHLGLQPLTWPYKALITSRALWGLIRPNKALYGLIRPYQALYGLIRP